MLGSMMGMMAKRSGFASNMSSPSAGSRVSARWRLGIALFALSISAAACGASETSTTPTLVTQAPAVESDGQTSGSSEAAPAEDSTPEGSTPENDTPENNTAEQNPAAEDAGESDETAAPAVNLFPDIDVLNIADGATVNLASELGGGDKATLLWFFAPH